MPLATALARPPSVDAPTSPAAVVWRKAGGSHSGARLRLIALADPYW